MPRHFQNLCVRMKFKFGISSTPCIKLTYAITIDRLYTGVFETFHPHKTPMQNLQNSFLSCKLEKYAYFMFWIFFGNPTRSRNRHIILFSAAYLSYWHMPFYKCHFICNIIQPDGRSICTYDFIFLVLTMAQKMRSDKG